MSEQTKARIALAVIVLLVGGLLFACNSGGDSWMDRHNEACRLMFKTSTDLMLNQGDMSLARADWRLVQESMEQLDDDDPLKADLLKQFETGDVSVLELMLLTDDHCGDNTP